MTGTAIWIAVYAAVVATLTLILGYGRSWWHEGFPLKVRVAREAVMAYQPGPDPETGKVVARLVSATDVVTISVSTPERSRFASSARDSLCHAS